MIDFLDDDLEKIKTTSTEVQPSKVTNQRTLEQPYSMLQGKSQSFNYVPFEERQKANSLESRVAHYVKRRRLDSEVYDKIAEANSLAQSLNIYKPTGSSSHKQDE